jgi:hypothetical protein
MTGRGPVYQHTLDTETLQIDSWKGLLSSDWTHSWNMNAVMNVSRWPGAGIDASMPATGSHLSKG